MSTNFTMKHLLGIRELTVNQITHLLDTAQSFLDISKREIKKVPALRGRTVINLFFEPSTRTRTSFEIAAKRLSADAVNISVSTSSVSKGETLLDTARNLEAMAPDCIVIRHSSSGARLQRVDCQRRRWRPRASNPGSPGRTYNPRTERTDRRFEGRNRRRHFALARSAIEHLSAVEAGRRRQRGRPGDPGSARFCPVNRTGRETRTDHRRRRSRCRCRHDSAHAERTPDGCVLSINARVCRPLWPPSESSRPGGERRNRDASRSD